MKVDFYNENIYTHTHPKFNSLPLNEVVYTPSVAKPFL